MLDNVIFVIVIVAVSVGLPVLILWLRDRGGFTGLAIERILGCAALLIGLAIIGGMFYVLFWRPEEIHFSVWGVFQLIVPIVFVYVGWKWLIGGGPGIEDTPVDFKCKELEESIQKARATLPWFIEQVDKNVDGAFIKFSLMTPNSNTEHIWAYVHSFRNGVFNVSLANDPFDKELDSQGRRDVPIGEVEDWQIMYPDNSIKGAYSLIALFEHFEAQGKRLSRKMQKQKAQLIDAGSG